MPLHQSTHVQKNLSFKFPEVRILSVLEQMKRRLSCLGGSQVVGRPEERWARTCSYNRRKYSRLYLPATPNSSIETTTSSNVVVKFGDNQTWLLWRMNVGSGRSWSKKGWLRSCCKELLSFCHKSLNASSRDEHRELEATAITHAGNKAITCKRLKDLSKTLRQ